MNLVIGRRSLRRLLSFLLLGGAVSACQTPRPPVNLGGIFNQPTTYAAAAPNESASNASAGQPIGGAVDKAVLLPGGDYSLATLRERPVAGQVPRVLCQAPSPDWATAIAMQQQLSASGNFFQGSSGQFAGSNSYTETIASMAGRTAGVVALRDGLYSACQAYANGVIGKDAYALILSQYGYLLVALAGNNGSSSGGGEKPSPSPPSTLPAGVAVAVNTTAAAPAPQQQQQGKASDTSSAPNVTQLATMQLQIMHALMVTCISAYDRSVRQHDRTAGGYDGNQLLDAKSCQGLIDWMKDSSKSLLGSVGGPSKGANGSGRTTIAQAELPDVVVLQVQNALRKQGGAAGRDLVSDGLAGAETGNAVRAYQKEHGLAVNGDVRDPATVAMLGVKQ